MTLNTHPAHALLTTLLMTGAMALTGCANSAVSAPEAENDADAVLALLPGEYTNRDQYDASPEAHRIAPQIGSDAPWMDQQFAAFKRVTVPAISGEVIALQWRRDSRDGPISRQRLWAFRTTASSPVMDFYTLKSEIDFSDETAFARLQPDDLISYGDTCALPVSQQDGVFRMAIPETCQIVSRSGREMTLSAEITLGETLTYQESGRYLNGDLVFQVPGSGPYLFTRLSD